MSKHLQALGYFLLGSTIASGLCGCTMFAGGFYDKWSDREETNNPSYVASKPKAHPITVEGEVVTGVAIH